jgi:hypothetical protein
VLNLDVLAINVSVVVQTTEQALEERVVGIADGRGVGKVGDTWHVSRPTGEQVASDGYKLQPRRRQAEVRGPATAAHGGTASRELRTKAMVRRSLSR